MTVRALTDAQKAAVVTIYTSKDKPKNIGQLAYWLNVSIRTIGRVLEEAGVTTNKKTPKDDTSQVTRLLYKHKITFDQLESLLNMVMVKPSIQEAFGTQTKRTKKSPTAHNGKQVLLALNLPASLELH